MRLDRVKLIAEMARQNLRNSDVADRSRISRVTITALRSGKSCTRETAQAIARALNVPVEDLLEEV